MHLGVASLYAGESTQGIPVVSQGRVARAKVAAALAARASDLASRGDETCPMRTILFVSGSCCVVAFLDDCGLTAA